MDSAFIYVGILDVDCVQKLMGATDGSGSHGVICLAANSAAFTMAIQMTRRRGTVVCVALPPGSFATPIFDVVMKRITIRGSIVGTRADIIEALGFAERGLITCNVAVAKLDQINDVICSI